MLNPALSHQIQLPGVDCATFNRFVRFVYTDDVCNDQSNDSPVEDLAVDNWCRLLELADRLCLTRLLQLVEQRIIVQLKVMSLLDAMHQALKILQRCQMHNADQLADFCLYWISVNYCDAGEKLGRLLRSLHPENQAYLNMHRWPPVWFIKEREYYKRCVRERIWCDRKLGSNQFNGITNKSNTKPLQVSKRSLCCLFFKRSKVTYTPL
jgi:Rho-related BTB domain-containing protein 1/2